MNLWEIKKEYRDILDMVYDSDIDEQTIKDTLESLDFVLEQKVDNYSRFIKQLEADSLTIKNRMESDEKKLKRADHLIDNLKTRIQETMKDLDKDKIKTELFEIKIVNNGGAKPMKIDLENVPMDYMKQTYEVDKAKIREDLERGKGLSFAQLLDRGQHLSIK